MNHEEHDIQVSLVSWSRLWPVGDLRRLLFHIPNGGKRSIVTAARSKAAGEVPGMPDLCLPVPRGGFGHLYLEVKTAKGRLSEAQKEKGFELSAAGNLVKVIRSVQEGVDAINGYLEKTAINREAIRCLEEAFQGKVKNEAQCNAVALQWRLLPNLQE